MKMTLAFAAAALALTSPAAAQPAAPPQVATSISQRTAGMERQQGYVPLYLDQARGRVLIEVSKLQDDMLYFVQIAKGIGNVDLGVDREFRLD